MKIIVETEQEKQNLIKQSEYIHFVLLKYRNVICNIKFFVIYCIHKQ